jgi:hypothetical protein
MLISRQDECPEYSRDEFFRFMKMLDTSIRFMFTSRPHISLPVEFPGFQLIPITANPSDLRSYLNSEIVKRNLFQKRVIRNDSSMQAKIVEEIMMKSKGM